MQAGVESFVLVVASLTGMGMAHVFVPALPAMQRFTVRYEPLMTRSGAVLLQSCSGGSGATPGVMAQI